MGDARHSVAIFSYNRGMHLRNCVESAQLCCPEWKLTVYDDGSTCPRTLEVLDWCRNQGLEVLSRTGEQSPRGGLYSNMNRALSHAAAHSVDLLLFLQDDMQFVRPVMPRDIADWKRLLTFAGVIQVVPVFIKDAPRSATSKYRVDSALGAYVKAPHTTIRGIADVGLIDVHKLHSSGWAFRNSEKENSDQAEGRGWYKVVAKDPCIAFTPWPCRRSQSEVGTFQRFLEWSERSGVHPLDHLTEGAVARLARRSLDELPLASSWLKTGGRRLPEDIRYGPVTLRGTLGRSARSAQRNVAANLRGLGHEALRILRRERKAGLRRPPATEDQ